MSNFLPNIYNKNIHFLKREVFDALQKFDGSNSEQEKAKYTKQLKSLKQRLKLEVKIMDSVLQKL